MLTLNPLHLVGISTMSEQYLGRHTIKRRQFDDEETDEPAHHIYIYTYIIDKKK